MQFITGWLYSVERCYYETFDCRGHEYAGQCYSGSSSSMSCPTCRNIGGQFAPPTSSTCYYYTTDCDHLAVADQCHTNRCAIAAQFPFFGPPKKTGDGSSD